MVELFSFCLVITVSFIMVDKSAFVSTSIFHFVSFYLSVTEHRNMPLEDALKLLARNFHDHIRSQREYMDRERTERGQYVGVVADRELQFLLRMLADGRWISLSEINLVIRYLTDRRDKMQTSPGDDRVFGRMPFTPADVKIEPPFKPSKIYFIISIIDKFLILF